jgi:prolyl-tRNA synthetase
VGRVYGAADSTAPSAEEVATPGVETIADLATFLGIAPEETAKVVFLVAEADGEQERLIFALIRGDLEVNEIKLAAAVGASRLRPALDREIEAVGAVAGYASPVGIDVQARATVIADLSVATGRPFVAGANRDGYHLRNVVCGRDYTPDIIADIGFAEAGDPCPSCGATLGSERGVEVGNIFKLGTRYSEAFDCTYLSESGDRRPVVMGSYGIGVGRLIACIAEEHHDENGLLWPCSVSPFDVHLVALRGGEEEADAIYAELTTAGHEVLYDDRCERPGVMFKDADLIGVPLRLTVSARSLEEGAVETKERSRSERGLVRRTEVAEFVKAYVQGAE